MLVICEMLSSLVRLCSLQAFTLLYSMPVMHLVVTVIWQFFMYRFGASNWWEVSGWCLVDITLLLSMVSLQDTYQRW